MGQKVHPYGFRLGFNRGWHSNWIAKRDYADLLHEDLKLKKELKFTSCADFTGSCLLRARDEGFGSGVLNAGRKSSVLYVESVVCRVASSSATWLRPSQRCPVSAMKIAKKIWRTPELPSSFHGIGRCTKTSGQNLPGEEDEF